LAEARRTHLDALVRHQQAVVALQALLGLTPNLTGFSPDGGAR
jgi:hypothetical protein